MHINLKGTQGSVIPASGNTNTESAQQESAERNPIAEALRISNNAMTQPPLAERSVQVDDQQAERVGTQTNYQSFIGPCPLVNLTKKLYAEDNEAIHNRKEFVRAANSAVHSHPLAHKICMEGMHKKTKDKTIAQILTGENKELYNRLNVGGKSVYDVIVAKDIKFNSLISEHLNAKEGEQQITQKKLLAHTLCYLIALNNAAKQIIEAE